MSKRNHYNGGREAVEVDAPLVFPGYHDHANDPMPGDDWLNVHQIQPRASATGSGRAGEHNFPLKLHYMLSDIEADGLGHIVSWSPHGRCFGVHKQKEFVAQMLPFWFQQTKFPSFQRQLNLYGFKRITAGPDKGCYYHELFLRSKPFLCCRIQRMKIKGNGTRQKSSPESEPNFYNAPFLPPSNQDSNSSMQSDYSTEKTAATARCAMGSRFCSPETSLESCGMLLGTVPSVANPLNPWRLQAGMVAIAPNGGAAERIGSCSTVMLPHLKQQFRLPVSCTDDELSLAVANLISKSVIQSQIIPAIATPLRPPPRLPGPSVVFSEKKQLRKEGSAQYTLSPPQLRDLVQLYVAERKSATKRDFDQN